jgi:hypothetical protein
MIRVASVTQHASECHKHAQVTGGCRAPWYTRTGLQPTIPARDLVFIFLRVSPWSDMCPGRYECDDHSIAGPPTFALSRRTCHSRCVWPSVSRKTSSHESPGPRACHRSGRRDRAEALYANADGRLCSACGSAGSTCDPAAAAYSWPRPPLLTHGPSCLTPSP